MKYNEPLDDSDLEKEALGILFVVKDSILRGEDLLTSIRRYLDTRPPPHTTTVKCHELINMLFKHDPHEEFIITELKVKPDVRD